MKKIKKRIWLPVRTEWFLLPLPRTMTQQDILRYQQRLESAGVKSHHIDKWHSLYVSNRREARNILQDLARQKDISREG